MLGAADKEYKFGLNLGTIARIWKAGCIIRAVFLDEITKAFTADPNLDNLLLDSRFNDKIAKKQDAWRRVLGIAINNGIATPAFSSSLAYYDSYRRPRVPANLIQAQRDFFGAHTYERIDKPGTFHTEWNHPRFGPHARQRFERQGTGKTDAAEVGFVCCRSTGFQPVLRTTGWKPALQKTCKPSALISVLRRSRPAFCETVA